ncbi:MAG: TMEM165/GDT1 family protein [Candidatus Omnitrophica bacterium]|nr:TMEM165/GDT1 family protein [Candidatus Omnitrophota bacterium]
MLSFITSFFMIAIAEIGDKTQLIALSFSTKYKPLKVLAGVFIGALAVLLLSVLIGGHLSAFIPMNILKIIVGFTFIGFGILTLKGEHCDKEGINKVNKFGPILTVAIAFFLAELGDKTQLATISLAAQYQSFFGVWLGSALGIVAADAVAIAVGVIAGKKLPQKTIKFISAGIFILFGILIFVEVFTK